MTINNNHIETLIESLSEIRSLLSISIFLSAMQLEHQGDDANLVINGVRLMNRGLTHRIENELRKEYGLEHRPEPRENVFPNQDDIDGLFFGKPWPGLKRE